MKEVLLRSRGVSACFGLLGLMNLLPLAVPIPVFVQLLVSSSCCVYIGCGFASKVAEHPSGEVIKAKKTSDEETVTTQDALRFPLTASAVLFGLYVLYKYVSPALVNFLLTLQFCLLTVVSISNLVVPYLPFSEEWKAPLCKIKTPKWMKDTLDITDIEPSKASLLTNLICALPVVFYYFTKFWVLNNIFGVLFSIVAIKSMNLGSFKVGFILLWLLFFYDIFWVYGTDVMVTVAKNLDIPIKLLFPYINDAGESKFSMLGLGDIVIPGIFVSICLKYDVDKAIKNKAHKLKDFKLEYFNLCFIGYVLGIVATFSALLIFNHAQPALLFLVPSCTLPVLAKGFLSKELDELKNYETDGDHKTHEEKEKTQQ
jgi:minor histocompatibility antigen H13